jgi:hypothetical protein
MADKRAVNDLMRSIPEARKLGASVRNYDEMDAYDETRPVNDNQTMVAFTLGMRGELNRRAAKRAAHAWRSAVTQYPDGIIVLSIAGYDDDPRALWEIAETREYVRQWAKLVDLTHSDAALASPLSPVSISVLAKCGALKDIDPDAVPVADDVLPGLPGGTPHKH